MQFTSISELCEEDMIGVGRCRRPDGPSRRVDVRTKDRVAKYYPEFKVVVSRRR